MKKTLLFISLVFSIISVVFFAFLTSISLHNNKGFVTTANLKAKTYYQYFTNGQIDLSKIGVLKNKGIHYIYGECADSESFTVYSGDIIKENKLIYGYEASPTGYWAIKLQDGNVVAVWSSNYPLKENQLISYSIEEQEEKTKLFEKSNETKVIGYYEYGID